MRVLQFTVSLIIAFFKIILTLVLATGFVVLMVPGIFLSHFLERPRPKAPQPTANAVWLSPEFSG